MRKFKLFSLTLLFVFSVCAGNGQQYPFADTARRLDELIKIWNDSLPGGVLTIARGNAIIYNKAVGLADMEHDIPVTTGTIFEAGSVSKQFTATAILMLIEEGLLSPDDDVRKYIPELPDYGATITIKNLLTHTSGLKDWGTIAMLGGWARGTRVYTQDHAREIIFRQKTLNFLPGSEYSYSNSNYTLLTTLVERISKQSLAEFTKKRILEPVGMKSSSWRDNFRRIVDGRAISYEKRSGKFWQDMPFENTYGHAALLTTTSDLVAWARYWANGKFGKKLDDFRATQGILNNGFTIEYTMGAVFMKRHNGFKEVSHSGATAGYRAWLAYFPEKDICIAILSNNANSSPVSLGRKATEIFLGKDDSEYRKVITPSAKLLAERAGIYKSTTGFDVIELENRGGVLSLKGGAELKAVSSDIFVSASQKLVFQKGGMLRVETTNGHSLYRKMAAFAPAKTELQEFAGTFTSEEADVTMRVLITDSGAVLFRSPATRMMLNPLYPDAFKGPNGMVVQFIRNSDNKISGFVVTMARAENIQFKKE